MLMKGSVSSDSDQYGCRLKEHVKTTIAVRTSFHILQHTDQHMLYMSEWRS